MKGDSLPKSVREQIYAIEHGLLEDPLGRSITRAIQTGVADEFVTGILTERVRRHQIASAFEGPFRLPSLGRGDLVAGVDDRNQQIRFIHEYLNAHCLTLGGSGSGKTTRSLFLALQVALVVPGVWLFDLRKREYRALRPSLSKASRELLIVGARDLKLNPLQVPNGVTAEDWAPRVADMLVLSLSLPVRASKILHAVIAKLYRHRSVSTFPTLFDVRETIARDASHNAQAKAAILDSLDPVLLSVGCVFRFRQGWDTSDLAKRQIVFELGGIAEADKDLILNCLMLSEFTLRVARGVSNPRMDLWISMDEAARLVSTANPNGGLADLLGLVRGTGVGLDLSVQSGDIAPSILSNTATKFVGRCGSASDYDLIAGAMGLTAEQRLWMRHNLMPGVFVGQLGEGPWRHPFVCRIPPMRLSRTSDTRSYLGDLAGLPVAPAVEYELWDPDHAESVEVVPRTEGTSPPSLDEAELRFLRAVIDQPGLPSSRYAKLAGMSPSKASKVRARLEDLGYLRTHEVATGGRGRNARVVEPLEPAFRAVKGAEGSEP